MYVLVSKMNLGYMCVFIYIYKEDYINMVRLCM